MVATRMVAEATARGRRVRSPASGAPAAGAVPK
jgi:hypothetical protein